MNLINFIVIIFFITIITVIFSPISAQEKNTSYLKVDPAYIEVVINKPDEQKKIPISYTNTSNQALTLDFSPIDFKQQGEHGEISFLQNQEGNYSYSLSSFLSFESETLEINPGEKKTFIVTAQNRQDLSPGGHYAAVIAKVRQGDEKVQTAIAPSVSTMILLRKVGGERFNLSLVDVDWPKRFIYFQYPKKINVTFQNEGNIHLIPYGTINTYDTFGNMVQKGVINIPSFIVFPETRRRISVDMQEVGKLVPISLNTVTISGQDSLKKTNYLYKETFLYVDPILLSVVSVGILSLFILKVRRKNKLHNT